MELEEIVTKLIGPISPLGDTNQDAIRLRNLTVTCDLAENMISKIRDVAEYAGSKEHSINKIGSYAKDFLNRIKEEE